MVQSLLVRKTHCLFIRVLINKYIETTLRQNNRQFTIFRLCLIESVFLLTERWYRLIRFPTLTKTRTSSST